MTTPIFDIDKTIQVILYVASHLKRKDFHKIFKVIYFADRNHLSEYGRAITGDSYIAMDDGPVPSNIYDIFKALRGDGFFADKVTCFREYFDVNNWNFIEPKKEANLRVLSESDIEMLDASLQEYGPLSWDEVREKSHDFAWRSTPKDRTMSVSNILLENGESDEYISYITEKIYLQKLCL